LKIRVKNHGIVRDAKFEFKPGLNLIIGKSSSGKSTVLEGIQSTIFNTPGDDHITTGQTKSALQIEYNGHKVARIRDLNAKEYKTVTVLDGNAYTKAGRSPIEDILNSLGIREVNLLDSKLRPNFSDQFNKPFLGERNTTKGI